MLLPDRTLCILIGYTYKGDNYLLVLENCLALHVIFIKILIIIF